MKFGEWLKKQREGKGLSREQLGAAAHITGSTVGQIERGSIKRPPMKRLEAFSRVLKVKLETIKKAIINTSMVAGLSALFFVNANNFLHVVSFSGGKDSTAMADIMALKGMKIDLVIFCDLGKEFPQLYKHNREFEEKTGLKITTVKPKYSFDYYFSEIPVQGRDGSKHYGYGWCGGCARWGTRIKKETIKKFIRKLRSRHEIVEYHGIAADELTRFEKNKDGRIIKHPLVEWGIEEKRALEYCYEQGYTWGGLYENLVRVSCYCCQNKRLSELEYIYFNCPDQWEDIERLHKRAESNPHLKKFAFRQDYALDELKSKFRTNQAKLDHPYFS